jgi:apolipoprotein N-acyltransferase
MMPVWRLCLIAFGLGLLMAIGQAPFSQPVAMGLGLVGIFYLYEQTTLSGRTGAFVMWSAGAGYFALGLRWIVEPFFVDAATHGWMAPFALAAMGGGLALFWALAGWGAVRLRAGTYGLAVTLTIVELLRATILTGFPWNSLAQAMIDTGFAGLLAYVGPHGLTLLICVLAAEVARGLAARAIVRLGVVVVACIALAWPVGHVAEPSETIVRLIQPNAPQDQKWDPEFVQTFFDRQVEYTAAEGDVDLTVWPETSVPFLMDQAGGAFARISAAADGRPVIVGAQRAQGSEYFNAAAVLGAEGTIDAIYDKQHLVPFGEYIPLHSVLGRMGLSALANVLGGNFSAGEGAQSVTIDGIGRALVLICYEGIFAEEIRYETRPDMMVLITNDAWFGGGAGPLQHLAQARMRTIEQGLPMVRAANTGVSAVIDPYGQITAQIGLDEAGYLDAVVPRAIAPMLYARFGDVPAIIALICAIFATILWSKAKRVDRNQKGA